MKALVTGGAGFVGSHLSERLLAQGAEVVAIDSFTDYYPRAIKERNLDELRGNDRYRLIEADLNVLDLREVLTGITHVFHLAAQAGVRKSWGRDFRTYTTLNVDATQRLLEPSWGCPSSAWCMPPVRPYMATPSRCRCGKTRWCSQCRHTASPS